MWATAPTAVKTEFIVTTCSRGTTCGRAADSPEDDEPSETIHDQRATNIASSSARTANQLGTNHQRRRARFARSARRDDPNGREGPPRTDRGSSRAGTEPRRRRDRPRSGGTIGVEQKRTHETALKHPVAELAHGAQFEQSAEFRQPGIDRHRAAGARASVTSNPILLEGCHSMIGNPPHTTKIAAGRAQSALRTRADAMMYEWRRQRIRRTTHLPPCTASERARYCSPTPICRSRRSAAASSTSSSTTTAAPLASC